MEICQGNFHPERWNAPKAAAVPSFNSNMLRDVLQFISPV